MFALESRGTWELASPPTDCELVGCRWIFSIKYLPDGTIERLKARLIAKRYSQMYGINYFGTFSSVARLNFIRILISVAINMNWLLYQHLVKNAILYGDLEESIYRVTSGVCCSGGEL